MLQKSIVSRVSGTFWAIIQPLMTWPKTIRGRISNPVKPLNVLPTFSRKKNNRRELESEFSCLCVKSCRFLVLPKFLRLLKHGGVVWLLGGDNMMDDPDKLMGGSSRGFRSTDAGFHAAELLPRKLSLWSCACAATRGCRGARFFVWWFRANRI